MMSDESGAKKKKKSTKKPAKKSEKSTVAKQEKKTVKKATKGSKGSVKSPKGETQSKARKNTKKQSKETVKPKMDGIADGVYIAIELDQKYLIQKFHQVTITTEGNETDPVLKVEILDQNLTIAISEINSSDKPPSEILSERITKSIKMPIAIVLDPSEKVNILQFEPFLLNDLLEKSSPYGYGSNFDNFDDQENDEDSESLIIDLIQSLNENIRDVFDNQFSYRI